MASLPQAFTENVVQFGAQAPPKKPRRADAGADTPLEPEGALWATPPEAEESLEPEPSVLPAVEDPVPPIVLEADVDLEEMEAACLAAANTVLSHNKKHGIYRVLEKKADDKGSWMATRLDSRLRKCLEMTAKSKNLVPLSGDAAVPMIQIICAQMCLKGKSQGEGLNDSWNIIVRIWASFENWVLEFYPDSSQEVKMIRQCQDGILPGAIWFTLQTIKTYMKVLMTPKDKMIGPIEDGKEAYGLGNTYPGAPSPCPGGYSRPNRNSVCPPLHHRRVSF